MRGTATVTSIPWKIGSSAEIEAAVDAELIRRPHLTRQGRKRVRRKLRRQLVGKGRGIRKPTRWQLPRTSGNYDYDRKPSSIDQRSRTVTGKRDTPRYLRENRQTFWPPFSRPLTPTGAELLSHPPRPRKRRS